MAQVVLGSGLCCNAASMLTADAQVVAMLELISKVLHLNCAYFGSLLTLVQHLV